MYVVVIFLLALYIATFRSLNLLRIIELHTYFYILNFM